MLVRRRLGGDIVLQFESASDETFVVKFRDILKIEKDTKSETGVKFTLNRYLDSEFVVKCADRKRLLGELKKYWKLFLEEKKERATAPKASGNEEEASYLDAIKKIIFRT